jgi:hypothetical protein
MLNNNTPKFKVDYNISYEVSKELQTITMYEKNATNLLMKSVCNLREQAIRQALIDLGWTPPIEVPTKQKNTDIYVVMSCCYCIRCLRNRKVSKEHAPHLPYESSRMIVCPNCGNKRCPHASDHTYNCTNSNSLNQEGSIFCDKNELPSFQESYKELRLLFTQTDTPWFDRH